MSNNTQPEIRFPGFMEDWEERKLNELAEFNPKSDLPERFEYVDLESVVGTELVRHRTENRYSAPSRAQRLAKKNDVFYQTVRPYQKNNYLFDLPYDNYVFSTGYAQMRPIGNGYFLLTLIQEEKFVNRVLERSTGTSYPAINSNDLAKLPVKVPADIQEQQKVGTFFKQIDNTITLHQRKLDLLKETKKGFLQKMFPKNGAKVPEIRFPGFTEDWEQRKAKELFIPKAEKNQPELPVLSVTQDHGVVYREQVGIDIKYDKATLKNYKVIHQGDFVISLRSFQGGFELSDKLGITSPAYTIFVPKNMDRQDNLFWKTKFKTFTFIESLKTVTFGIRDGKSISFSEFGDLKLFFPKNIEEQQKIGNFFKQLDDTITLHQRKLDLLKEMKKGFLQKMFV
ncbi:TPA: restriction endonuclease subunit S [Enterococcus faecium]|uniref:restriction endonuclease subunit S n=1 Tax=Enterococcus TaxID=1350 RepID=UPI0010280873|nr:restriction endonuclease subunit S [Enterococcus faecium]MDT6268650.1 restriction endonuclease subunit S [Enterococcus faecium]WCG10679.1 restriction endonuclease subunit S [Enterococcus faecium]VFA76384.1 Type I restriction-modification system, specificity subunit S [Enterococcus faecium]